MKYYDRTIRKNKIFTFSECIIIVITYYNVRLERFFFLLIDKVPRFDLFQNNNVLYNDQRTLYEYYNNLTLFNCHNNNIL